MDKPKPDASQDIKAWARASVQAMLARCTRTLLLDPRTDAELICLLLRKKARP